MQAAATFCCRAGTRPHFTSDVLTCVIRSGCGVWRMQQRQGAVCFSRQAQVSQISKTSADCPERACRS
jgi:hypothetical protein